MKKALCVLLFLITCRFSDAQVDSAAAVHIRANYNAGVLLPEYGFLNYLADGYVQGVEVSAEHETSGRSAWDRLYKYPSMGVSFFHSTMGNNAIFGKQYSLYPYFSLYLLERKRFALSYQLGVGASYVTRKFDFTADAGNVAIGSHFNIHFHTQFDARVRLFDKTWLNGGLSFNHISNANLSEPNVGLNFCTLYSGITYMPGKAVARNREAVPDFEKMHEFMAEVFVGMKHTRTFESFQYPAAAIGFDYLYRPHHRFAMGGGADFFYDSSTEPQMKRLNKPFQPSYAYTSGLHVFQEFIYNRFSLTIQEGLYLGLPEKLNGYAMYNRALARWRLTDHFFVNLSMKTHVVVLDFPELGAGFAW